MDDDLFKQKEVKDKEEIHLDELTSAEIKDIEKPIMISGNIKKILNSKYVLLVANEDTRVIRLIPLNSTNVIKIVIYLETVSDFIHEVIKFYKRNNIEIVYTSGICFRKNKDNQEDCIYEAYIDLNRCCEGFSKPQIIEELEKIQGVQKIFLIDISLN
ncbi:MAG: hypothetical protein ACTSRZ_11840 [Promethearchaeota archaeon]